MELLGTLVVAAVALGVAAAVMLWWLRRRAAFDSTLAQRGWQLSRSGDATVVSSALGWTITVNRSFAAQMSPPSSHIVVSTWTSPTPRARAGTLVIGPAPPPQLLDLAADLIGSAGPGMTRWLGIDNVTDGHPLGLVSHVDNRLLVLATENYEQTGPLTTVADAVSAWCDAYHGEREQPVLTVDDAGICLRVRIDVMGSLEKIDAFVALGTRCRDAIARPSA